MSCTENNILTYPRRRSKNCIALINKKWIYLAFQEGSFPSTDVFIPARRRIRFMRNRDLEFFQCAPLPATTQRYQWVQIQYPGLRTGRMLASMCHLQQVERRRTDARRKNEYVLYQSYQWPSFQPAAVMAKWNVPTHWTIRCLQQKENCFCQLTRLLSNILLMEEILQQRGSSYKSVINDYLWKQELLCCFFPVSSVQKN